MLPSQCSPNAWKLIVLGRRSDLSPVLIYFDFSSISAVLQMMSYVSPRSGRVTEMLGCGVWGVERGRAQPHGTVA